MNAITVYTGVRNNRPCGGRHNDHQGITGFLVAVVAFIETGQRESGWWTEG